MKKLHLFWFLILLLIKIPAIAQKTRSLEKLTQKICSDLPIKLSDLKDDRPFYAFSLEIKLRKLGNKVSVIEAKANDSIGYVAIDNFAFLKKYDYGFLMKDAKEKTLQIPILMMPYRSDTVRKEKNVPFREFNKSIQNLFKQNKAERSKIPSIITDPILAYTDKKFVDKLHRQAPSFTYELEDIEMIKLDDCFPLTYGTLKDSIASYSFTRIIEVSRKNGKIIVDAAYHDHQIKEIAKLNLDCLKAYDFNKMMPGAKKVTFVIPTLLIISNYTSKPIVERSILFDKNTIRALFGAGPDTGPENTRIYLNPHILYADKGVYD